MFTDIRVKYIAQFPEFRKDSRKQPWIIVI